MLVVFPPIFVVDTKLIDDNNFVAPLKAFFKYACIQKFITRYPFVGISEKKKPKKTHRESDTYYINNDRTNVIKFMKVTSNSTQCKKRRNSNN